MDTIFSYWEKQLIAYAKGHYGFVDFSYEFLKYFASSMYDLTYEDVYKYNVNHMLFALHRKMDLLQDLEVVVESMFKLNNYQGISYDDVIYILLSDIQGARTGNVLNDFTVDWELQAIIREEHNQKISSLNKI